METWRRNLAVIWIANFFTALGLAAFLPFLPFHVAQLGVTSDDGIKLWSGLLLGIAPLIAAFLGPVWGALGDRYGRKLMVVRALFSVTLFVGAMGFATNAWHLLACRILQGVFSGYVAPGMTLVSVVTPADRQGKVLGSLESALVTGTILGPLLGGVLGDRFGHASVFFTCAALSLVATLLVVAFASEGEVRAVPTDEPGAAEPPTLDPGPERPRPLLQGLRETLRDPGLQSLMVALFLFRFGSSMVTPLLALFVKDLQGATPERLSTLAGAVYAAAAVTNLFCAPLWGAWSDRRGPRAILAWSSLGVVATLIPQAAVVTVAQLFALRLLHGVFLAGPMPAGYAYVSARAGPARRGETYGLAFSALQLAFALAPLAGGGIAAAWGLRQTFVVAGALVLLAAAWARLRLPPPGPPSNGRPAERSALPEAAPRR
jgi:MFS family permease